MRHPLLTFLVAGAVLATVRATMSPAPPIVTGAEVRPPVVVEAAHLERVLQTHVRATGRQPSEEEREAIVDAEVRDRLLLRAALDSGLDRIDPRISWRLMEKMRFLGKADEHDPAATVRQARALGLQDHDVVIERMLIEKMGTVARHRARRQEVDEAELAAFFREHRERWMQPGRTTLRHLFFDGELDQGRREAEQALAEITSADRLRDPEVSMGSPFVAGSRLAAASDATLAKLLGGEFTAAVAMLPVGSWSGPVPSPFGWHLVLVGGRDAGRPAELDQVRSQVLAAFKAERGDRDLEELVRELRRTYEVAIEPSDERSASRQKTAANDA